MSPTSLMGPSPQFSSNLCNKVWALDMLTFFLTDLDLQRLRIAFVGSEGPYTLVHGKPRSGRASVLLQLSHSPHRCWHSTAEALCSSAFLKPYQNARSTCWYWVSRVRGIMGHLVLKARRQQLEHALEYMHD